MLTRFQIACGACSCVAGIAAGLMRPAEPSAPAPAAASVTIVSKDIDDSLPKADRLIMFGQRWGMNPLPAEGVLALQTNTRVLAAQMPTPVERRPSEIGDRHHVDRVCGDRGRRYFFRHHHRYWRCRR